MDHDAVCNLDRDTLTDIMARLDGSTLASTACTCSHLRYIASDQSLWKELCHSTWPSTTLESAQHLLIHGFHNYYAHSYPLILYNTSPMYPNLKTHASPSHFASLVDVYYKNNCILSRVFDGIPEAVDVYDDHDIGSKWDVATATDHLATDRQKWFADCPFKLDLFRFNCNQDTGDDNEIHHHDVNDVCTRALPSISLVEDGKLGGDFCEKLEEDMRLSWVLLDKKKGKAVNISSWKPLLVRRSWPSDADYIMRFGCIIPVEQSMLPQEFAECVILARCTLLEKEACMRWKEISMCVQDMAGAHVNGRKSLMVLNQALYCLRSKNHLEVDEGYRQYERLKREMKSRKEFKEKLADRLCVSIEILVFMALCYACTIFYSNIL